MPLPPARTARSSSRSSKRSEPLLEGGGDFVAVGEIVGAHALGGLLRVRPYQPPAPSLGAGRRVVIEQAGARREVRLLSAAPHGRGLVLVALAGVAGRSSAEALVGARLLVRTADLPPPGDNEFYWYELRGFAVETTAGERIGTIDDIFSTGVNDVWVVRGAEREHLIPVIEDVVRSIDRAARCVVIEPMPGLLD